MSGHTPGPWSDERMVGIAGAHKTGLNLAFICSASDERRGECEANARLIAAAPELLAAARETVSAMTDRFSLMGADDDYIYDELGSELAAAFFSARAAIAKATGETP